MAARRFNLVESSFGSGYGNLGSSWAFRPGSRAENLHRGRSGINRRFHNVYLESEGIPTGNHMDRSYSETMAKQSRSVPREMTRSWSGYQRSSSQPFADNAPRSSFNSDRKNSTLPGRIPVRVEEGEWDRHTSSTSEQRREYYEEDIVDGPPPPNYSHQYESNVYHQATPYHQANRQNTRAFEEIAQPKYPKQSDMYDIQPEASWQPVKVIRYSDSEQPRGINGTSINETQYSVHEASNRREPENTYYTKESARQNSNRQWDERYDSSEHQRPVENSWNRYIDVNQQTPIYEPPRPIQRANTWRSTQTNNQFHPPSNWDNNYDRSTTYSLNDYPSDRFRSSESWEHSRGTPEDAFRYSTRSTSSFSEPSRAAKNGVEYRTSRNSGPQTFGTHYQEPPELQNMWQKRNEASQTGPRSRGSSASYFEESSSNFRPRTKSMDRTFENNATDTLRHMSFSGQGRASGNDDKEFLGKLQKELENQRLNWQPEIDRLLNSTIVADDFQQPSFRSTTPFEAEKNSYVDTTSSIPIFKAYVDIKEFAPESVNINFDRLTNKVIVEASEADAQGTVGRTFTQKIPLPRYADDTKLKARVNSNGVLRIEVPLVYYFPEETKESKTKAFVYEARRNSADGSHMVEIIVKPGSDFSIQDLQTEVVDGKLLVWGRKGKQKKVIQNYVLPSRAVVQGIKERVGSDGCLTIRIPLT